jgi:anti-anti-sigma regulatory factor
MLATHAAYAEPRIAPRVALGAELRLATVRAVIEAIDRVLHAEPKRIELDASRLRFMTEGARRVLLVATSRLAAREIELVIVGCEPFD